MTYLVVFSSICFALLIGVIVLIAVRLSKLFEDALIHANALHTRSMQTLDTVLDRFMAIDFESYQSAKLTAEALEGFQELPEVPDEADLGQEPRPWGQTDYEEQKERELQELIAEDQLADR